MEDLDNAVAELFELRKQIRELTARAKTLSTAVSAAGASFTSGRYTVSITANPRRTINTYRLRQAVERGEISEGVWSKVIVSTVDKALFEAAEERGEIPTTVLKDVVTHVTPSPTVRITERKQP